MTQKITREQLQAKITRGDDFVLLDALEPEHYEQGHLPGALSMPCDQVGDLASKLIPGKDTQIVVYCLNAACTASPEAARRLGELGYRHVYDYAGGTEDWLQAGLELEK